MVEKALLALDIGPPCDGETISARRRALCEAWRGTLMPPPSSAYPEGAAQAAKAAQFSLGNRNVHCHSLAQWVYALERLPLGC